MTIPTSSDWYTATSTEDLVTEATADEWNIPQNIGIDCPEGQTKNIWGNCVNDVDPWAGFQGGWGYDPTGLETERADYWSDIVAGFGEHGLQWGEYSHFFDPYSSFWGERGTDLIDAAQTDIGQLQRAYQLLQAQAVSEKEFTAGQAFDTQELADIGVREEWYGKEVWNPDTQQMEIVGGALGGLQAQQTALGTMFGLDYGNINAAIDCQVNPELCGELGRQIKAAGSIWGLEKGQLVQMGIDEAAIATLRSLDLAQRGLDVSSLWGLEKLELERLGIDAIDIWALEKAAIEREQRGAVSMWGFQRTGLEEGWQAEEEAISIGARRGLGEYRREQERTISGRGFATGATGFEYAEEDIYRDVGRQLDVGREELSRQLGMGQEQFEQTYAGLSAKLDIGTEELENVLEGYGSQIAIGTERADATIEEYLREGKIDDEQARILQQNITDQITLGSTQFTNLATGLQADRVSALEEYNINIANVQQQIDSGQISVDQAIAENLLSFNQAIKLGLMTEAEALGMGAKQYQIATEDVFEDLQEDIWSTMESWRTEQEAILAGILAGDPEQTGEPTGALCIGVQCPGGFYLDQNTCECIDPDALADWTEAFAGYTGELDLYGDVTIPFDPTMQEGDCVISTHALSTGGMLKSDQSNAVDWCTKNLHGKWWGEVIRRGYRYLGRKHIANKTAETIYKEFKECLEWANGKRPFEFKIAARYYWRILQTFIVGLFVREK